MRTAKTIIELIRERGRKGLPLDRIYRLLYNPDLYLKAYGKISRNSGAMTPRNTEEIVDGMSQEKINTIIEALRHERYQWKPVRRTHIPKKSGEQRPLGMPTWSDKLLQEVVHMLLEAYYEEQFSVHSHGFRPQRGCHTVLREIYGKWTGVTWFIEGDLSQCFDKLDHTILLEVLSEKIHDGRFIQLIKGILDAGYLEGWKFHNTYSGVPQGGAVSPILSNIYLDKLDKFVETVLIPAYTKGQEREENPEYRKARHEVARLRRVGLTEEAEAARKKMMQLPSMDTKDPNFRRLKYVRYADDFLLGFIGPKEEAEEILQKLAQFLQDELKLELSQTNTLITHARTERARFLGYEIHILQDNSHRGNDQRRSLNGKIGLRVPEDVLEEKCRRYMRHGTSVHRKELTENSDFTILETYQAEYRGIVEYYRLAYNLGSLTKLYWVMDTSLTKTLAHKYKMSVYKVYRKYEATWEVDGKPYKGLRVSIQREGKEPLVAKWGGISLAWNPKAKLDDQSKTIWSGRTELEQRLLADTCENCGSKENVEVHHIRALKDLNKYTGRDKPDWVKVMAARHRKTMVLCRKCHDDVHAGRPIRPHMSSSRT